MNRRRFGQLAFAAAVGHRSLVRIASAQTRVGSLKPKLSIMLWTLGRQLPPEDAIEIVNKAGYSAVELLSDYKRWDSQRLKAFSTKLHRMGIVVDSMVTGGIPVADPNNTAALVESVKSSIPFAKNLGCRQMILTAKALVPGQPTATKQQVIVDTFKKLSDVLAPENMEVLLEPIDLLERKDSAVTSVHEGFEIARMINRPNVKVLYDFYHEQRGSGNLLEKFDGNTDLIGLVHVADVPNRTEPGTGEMNYPSLYKRLAEMKYDRYIAMEFYPTGDPVATLKKAKAEVEAIYAAV